MNFESDQLYHVYNQGNNKQDIFFCRENYLFFLRKIKKHILPYADIIAYCLMPNHFHLMLRTDWNSNSALCPRLHPLNKSIGILLASYTRAINNQNKTSGSLFRSKTKSKCLTVNDSMSPAYLNSEFGTYLNVDFPEKNYMQQCFDYIHYNPVEAGLVDKPEDWEFSSYRDYKGIHVQKMVNKNVAKEFGLEW